MIIAFQVLTLIQTPLAVHWHSQFGFALNCVSSSSFDTSQHHHCLFAQMALTAQNVFSRMSRISFPNSIHTFSPDTTATAEWGPGTALGRGLIAFGEAAKDVVDKRTHQRRLAAFKHTFPHTNAQPESEALNKIYDNLLQSCRWEYLFHIQCVKTDMRNQTRTLWYRK